MRPLRSLPTQEFYDSIFCVTAQEDNFLAHNCSQMQ